MPLAGEKIRMESSSQPERMYFPFLGKKIERHVIFGTAIFNMGDIVEVLQTTISEPEQVPKMSSKSLTNETALILVEWQA